MLDNLPHRLKFSLDLWKAEDDKLSKTQKAMETMRKIMYNEGSPIMRPLPGEDLLPLQRMENNNALKMAVMQNIMYGE